MKKIVLNRNDIYAILDAFNIARDKFGAIDVISKIDLLFKIADAMDDPDKEDSHRTWCLTFIREMKKKFGIE